MIDELGAQVLLPARIVTRDGAGCTLADTLRAQRDRVNQSRAHATQQVWTTYDDGRFTRMWRGAPDPTR